MITRSSQAIFRMVVLFFIVALVTGCEEDRPSELSPEDAYVFLDLPEGVPYPEIPEDNKLSRLRIALGKKLFFDPSLSSDGTVSCGSCHFQEIAFSDFNRLSEGVEGRVGFRNSPSLANVAYGRSFFRDGGAPTLELQILAPFDSESEMNLPLEEVIRRLNADPEYVALFNAAYQRDPDPFSLVRAIANFERTLISLNSRYDQYTYGGFDHALTDSEIRGLNLFNSAELNCQSCHSGFNFTNESFENNGIYEVYADSGRTRVTLNRVDFAKFKVPSLRNVELTGPYMHDGSMETLEQVIDHYASGGKGHFNQSTEVSGFTITEDEKRDLINFLKALTDIEFVRNPDFQP